MEVPFQLVDEQILLASQLPNPMDYPILVLRIGAALPIERMFKLRN
jgi:hypothetical protein